MIDNIAFATVLFLCCVYFAAGFIDSVAGGGGLISIPLFLLVNVPADFVLGTNKMVTPFGTASALALYAKNGFVLWRMALLGLPAALLGGFLGSKTILLFDNTAIGHIVIFLLPLGIAATFISKNKTAEIKQLTKYSLYVYCPLICFCIGFYDGFFGPGTGSFFILAFHSLLGIGLIYASATAKLFNFASGVSSAIAFALQGKVLYFVAIPLAVSNIAGNVIGSKLAIKTGASFIRKILIVSLTILFISLIWKFFIGTPRS